MLLLMNSIHFLSAFTAGEGVGGRGEGTRPKLWVNHNPGVRRGTVRGLGEHRESESSTGHVVFILLNGVADVLTEETRSL
jgi:hypothetical protein